MADWPVSESGNRYGSIGAVTATSAGTVITAGAANAKGGWSPLITTTDTPGAGLLLTFYPTIVNIITRLVDIGIGPSGAEQVIIPNLLITNGFADTAWTIYIPIRIPVGVRLAARMQASTASNTLVMAGQVMAPVWNTPTPYSRVVAYGVVTGTSRGTSITPGATANTKPTTWTAIANTTTEVARGLIIGVGHGLDTGRAIAASWLLDVGVGPTDPPQTLIPNYLIRSNINEEVRPLFSPVLPCNIPQGSRIAVRAQCSTTDASDRLFDCALYVVI